jgi:CheY-like chemotaxis protein
MTHVLIVDDDEDDRDLFCTAVHEIDKSINCAMARNGEEALQALRKRTLPKPHLIFLDLNMPRVNGVQCLQELKKDKALQHIPVVIYSTSKLSEDKNLTHLLGAADFITKPSSFTELCKLIKDTFSKELIGFAS